MTDSTLQDGQPFAAAASGFEDASLVAFYVHSTPRYLTTVRADAAGEASAHLVMPDDLAPGLHELLAIGIGPDGRPRTVSIPIAVLPGRYVAPSAPSAPVNQPALAAAHSTPATGPLPLLGPATGSLPRTGLALGGYLLAAAACLGAGAAALRAGRSRQRRQAVTGD